MAHAYVVKFPHPGGEHNRETSERQAWNVGDHRRKFLRRAGRYLAEDGKASAADLVFWGEWEPQSLIIERWPAQGALPQLLHDPRWEATDLSPRQNTDPWVFGDNFLYSNCKQNTRDGTPTSLQRLTPGSVIFFGSTVGGQFVLDTVFVAAASKSYTLRNPPATDEAFRYCTLQSITSEENMDWSYTLYEGATLDRPYHGMYSFVPCRRYDRPNYRFARPTLQLPAQYKLSCTRQAYGSKKPMSVNEAKRIWDSAKLQTISSGGLIGLSFETPLRDP